MTAGMVNAIPHSRGCKRPDPVVRASWAGTPEAWCPACGRACPVPPAEVRR